MSRCWSVKQLTSADFPDSHKYGFSNRFDRENRAKMKRAEAKKVRKSVRGLGRHG
jgi:hypothetical protein